MVPKIKHNGKVFIQHHHIVFKLAYLNEVMFWHNLQIKITTEAEHTLRTDSTFCGDMAIWEQDTGVLYQVAVYGG
jgi:hypothetical protein